MTDKPLQKRRPNELRDLIEGPDFRAQLLKALPNAMSPERFIRITATSMMRNPKLMQCNRDTFFRCLLDLSAMGLEPDGRQAHLIPRKNKTGGLDCTLIIDYKGIKEMLYRNGDIVDEHSDVVGDLDLFEYEYGTNKHLTHRPNTHNRGKIFCVYSFITLPRGGNTFDVMSSEEIETVRKRSSSPDNGPWLSDWSEMAKKTVFKRLAKGLPLSPKTRDAIELDNTYEVEHTPMTSTPMRAVIGGTRASSTGDDEPQPSAQPIWSGEHRANIPEPDPEPAEADGVPQTPQERVSDQSKADKPPGPLTLVRTRLKEAGFKPEALVKLLIAVRLVHPDVADISHVPAKALEEALSDWENCIKRLEVERAS